MKEETYYFMTAKETKENDSFTGGKESETSDVVHGESTGSSRADTDDGHLGRAAAAKLSEEDGGVGNEESVQLVDEKKEGNGALAQRKLAFIPNLDHSDSLVISEIDSNSMNGSLETSVGEDLAAAAEDESEVKGENKLLRNNDNEKPVIEDSSPDEADVVTDKKSQQQDNEKEAQIRPKEIDDKIDPQASSIQEEHRKDDSPSVIMQETFDNVRKEVGSPSQSLEHLHPQQPFFQEPQQPQPQNMADVLASGLHSRNSFMEMNNTPMLMVPNQQHMIMSQQMQQIQQQLQQQMHQQMQQQQMQMNFVPQQQQQPQQTNNTPSVALPSPMYANNGNGNHMMAHSHSPPLNANANVPPQNIAQPSRRKMKLRLEEKIDFFTSQAGTSKKSIFSHFRSKERKGRTMSAGDSSDFVTNSGDLGVPGSPQRIKTTQDRGEMNVSWYDGTSAVELKEHVRKSIESKLRLGRKKLLLDMRVIDESVEPHEEIVLSPYIPDGSSFLLKFRIKDLTSKHNRAPPSPSAAPSPPGELEQELQRQINDVLNTSQHQHRRSKTTPSRLQIPDISLPARSKNEDQKDSVAELTGNEILSQRLEKLNETISFLHDEGLSAGQDVKTEKKQVIFVIANYFVLFLSLIAVSAEIHERAPDWIIWINENVTIVQNCAADKDELFKCVSEGNFSGLVASVILWASQSVATKRLFLFGFDSPQKLWTVVYEAGVSAFCWGTSYLAIRRGLNPDTRTNCLSKYWKDAVYGSLAGFNAAFMKAVLKNLLPKADEILDVMEHRQIRLFNFLSRAIKSEAEL